MSENLALNIFLRSGIASLKDLEDDNTKRIFSYLNEKQEVFLSEKEYFRDKKYKWPDDALHTWSRIWEYPYVYANISNLINTNKLPENPKVLDFGSGVTFFPFALADLNCEIACTDNDPICINDLIKAAQYFSNNKLKAVLSEDYKIPLESNSFDVIYSVSVLEHIPDLKLILSEINRILKDGGYLILTFDLCLKGDAEINSERYHQLIDVLSLHYDLVFPEVTVHPNDMLTSDKSKYPLKIYLNFKTIIYYVKISIMDIIRFKALRILNLKTILAVQGMVLKKKRNI